MKGLCEGLMAAAEMDYEGLLTEEEVQAIKDAEERTKQ